MKFCHGEQYYEVLLKRAGRLWAPAWETSTDSCGQENFQDPSLPPAARPLGSPQMGLAAYGQTVFGVQITIRKSQRDPRALASSVIEDIYIGAQKPWLWLTTSLASSCYLKGSEVLGLLPCSQKKSENRTTFCSALTNTEWLP